VTEILLWVHRVGCAVGRRRNQCRCTVNVVQK